MCDKLPYENPRIDKCMIDMVKYINQQGFYTTIASCCGHGKYRPTIVCRLKTSGNIFEYYTHAPLLKRKKHRYYKRDSEGYYYLDAHGGK